MTDRKTRGWAFIPPEPDLASFLNQAHDYPGLYARSRQFCTLQIWRHFALPPSYLLSFYPKAEGCWLRTLRWDPLLLETGSDPERSFASEMYLDESSWTGLWQGLLAMGEVPLVSERKIGPVIDGATTGIDCRNWESPLVWHQQAPQELKLWEAWFEHWFYTLIL